MPTPTKRKEAPVSRPAKRRKLGTAGRSIWNATDDWDQLVADSQLSTSSISRRRPRPRGLQTLARCASEAATRGFKRLWEDPAGVEWVAGGENTRGALWTDWWEVVPDHLREGVREGVFRQWGSFLTAEMISRIFAFPPTLYLPGELLPTVSAATKLKPFWPSDMDRFTSLVLKHAAAAPDVAIAGLIHHMPNLEKINLKGCSLAGEKTVQAMLKHGGLRRINLKGTAIGEAGVKQLLDAFASQLEVFKVDQVVIENVNSTFASSPYPKMTHLCLPGDMLNVPSKDWLNRIRRYGLAQQLPQPKATPQDSILQWHTMGDTFPSLTHLALPRLFLPNTIIRFPRNTLTKLSLESGPAVPAASLTELIKAQSESLKTIRLGYISTYQKIASVLHFAVDSLGAALGSCQLEDFRWRCGESRDTQAIMETKYFAPYVLGGLKSSWRPTLKSLVIEGPFTFEPDLMCPNEENPADSVLEILHMPGVKISDPAGFCKALHGHKQLRSLDLSGSAITDEDVFALLDACKMLSTIDLTSCRGIKVQHRRNIFKAWEDARRPVQDAVPRVTKRGTRSQSALVGSQISPGK